MRLIALELKLLLRGWTVPVGVVAILAAGMFSIAYGGRVIARQQATIAGSAALQEEEHRAILSPQSQSTAGDQLYYLFFHTVRQPSAWAPVAIGQRDVQAFNLKIRIQALQGQLYNAELGSPLLAAFGNFDLAFVMVVLSPLLVIALTFNIWSAERESGTWDLVRSQPRNPLTVMARKFLLRALVAWLPLLLLQLVATATFNLPLDGRWWSVAGWLLLYVGFWIAAAAAVAAAGRPSEVNVLVCMGIWLVCTVLGPALVNVVATIRYPLPDAMELTVLQRQGYHSAWDAPVAATMTPFYVRYPEWRSTTIPTTTYSNGWYYAMQQRGDDAAAPAAERYRRALVDRERWATRASALFPPALLQHQLTRTARTDLDAYLAYLDSVANYHERLKRHFFPVVFSEVTVADVDWTKTPRHYHQD